MTSFPPVADRLKDVVSEKQAEFTSIISSFLLKRNSVLSLSKDHQLAIDINKLHLNNHQHQSLLRDNLIPFLYQPTFQPTVQVSYKYLFLLCCLQAMQT